MDAHDLIIPDLVRTAAERLDDEDARRLLTGLVGAVERPVTLRANTLKADADQVARALEEAGIAAARVPWYPDAFVLEGVRERAVWDLPLYQEGKVYLQSLSSMVPPLVLAPRDRADVLDMCAAPGGKTSELAALMPTAHLTACEMKAPRAEKLAYNLEKLGVSGVNVMRVDARRLDTFFSFDQILLDAPCTGTGTVRAGDERACGRVTDKLLAKVTSSQRALLDRALTVLKPGGELVYSTCSILEAENEDQVRAALKRHRDCSIAPLATPDTADEDAPELPPTLAAVVEAAESGAIPLLPTTLPGTLVICPTRTFEGFFVAKITKRKR